MFRDVGKDEALRLRLNLSEGSWRTARGTCLLPWLDLSDVNVRMNVWCAAEVNNGTWSFDAPHVPDFIVAEVFLLIKRES